MLSRRASGRAHVQAGVVHQAILQLELPYQVNRPGAAYQALLKNNVR